MYKNFANTIFVLAFLITSTAIAEEANPTPQAVQLPQVAIIKVNSSKLEEIVAATLEMNDEYKKINEQSRDLEKKSSELLEKHRKALTTSNRDSQDAEQARLRNRSLQEAYGKDPALREIQYIQSSLNTAAERLKDRIIIQGFKDIAGDRPVVIFDEDSSEILYSNVPIPDGTLVIKNAIAERNLK